MFSRHYNKLVIWPKTILNEAEINSKSYCVGFVGEFIIFLIVDQVDKNSNSIKFSQFIDTFLVILNEIS